MTPSRRRQSLLAMLAAVPLTPLERLRAAWGQVPATARLRFLVEVLTPEERCALALGFEDEEEDAP